MNDIVDVTFYVHIVKGKVICFGGDVMDIRRPDCKKDLLSLADRLYETEKLPRTYGKDSVCVLEDPDGSGNYSANIHHINSLPVDVQAVIRRVCPEYCG